MSGGPSGAERPEVGSPLSEGESGPEQGRAGGFIRTRPRPVAEGERIDAIDILRGFALMGVLLMNMQSFAMPFSAYLNPTSYGAEEPLNFWLWSVQHVLADAKFITIFSMLFGAGVFLMTSRARERTGRSIGVHYRRMFWLALFGAAHGIFIWYGDILLAYAICGMVAYWLRRLRPWLLVMISVVLIAIPTLLLANFDSFAASMPPEELQAMQDMWAPSAEAIAADVAAYRGGYQDHLPVRFESWASMFSFILLFGWRILGLMLLGMALLRTGVITATRSTGMYIALVVIGFAVGVPVVIGGIRRNIADGWEPVAGMGMNSLYNYVGSLLMAFGWIGVVMLACRSDRLAGLKLRFAAVGRMAFTNYIMQSLICTTIFYGHGFGLFGRVDRLGQLGIVAAIAIVQLWYSPWWLKRFRFGPLEWLWRTLTYWKIQPLRRDAVAENTGG